MAKGKRIQKKVNTTMVIADEQKLKAAKQTIVAITQYMKIIDDQKEAIKETIEDLSAATGIEKKNLRKIAKTMYTSSYQTVLEENEHFEFLYETLVEGRKVQSQDPVSQQEETEEE